MFFMRHANIPCEEILLPLATAPFQSAIPSLSPSGRVPVLELDNGEKIYDSLAIGLVLHELFPDKNVFPKEAALRHLAYCACSEMHSGFTEMRRVLTHNARAKFAPNAWRSIAGDVKAQQLVLDDVNRMTQLWASLLSASKGPFLCGEFGYVDAFFVPVISRFRSYGMELPVACESYAQRIEALPGFARWMKEAREEPFIIEKYEYPIERLA
jgi:glutathione S-transferase